ncbi:MAG TPA: DUF4194 domain-containing protein [Gammaproteobacteria bacterium]|nr:DUF4194 domain-containing protein [Gammaproteobacteria bacterium]
MSEAGETHADNVSDAQTADLSVLMISLLKGVVYHDADPVRWKQLLGLQARVREYAAVLGLELILDEAEAYAFFRSRKTEIDDTSENFPDKAVPRLIARRPLSFPVSLLLALLRKKLAEFDASGGETRLILSRDDMLELMQIFLPPSSNEAKLVDKIDQHINKVVELGFLRRLKQNSSGQLKHYEVRRILKAFVDAQWLADFDVKLEQYKQHITEKDDA